MLFAYRLSDDGERHEPCGNPASILLLLEIKFNRKEHYFDELYKDV